MKLRCSTNSIRIRLRKSEVSSLIEEKFIEEFIGFQPNQKFCFSIGLSELAENISANLECQKIQLIIPSLVAKNWAETEQVGMETTQQIGDGQQLSILVEKDYPCVTRADEDKSDFFGELQNKESNAC